MTAIVRDLGTNPLGRRATAHCMTCRVSLTPHGAVDRPSAVDAAKDHNFREHS